MKYNRCVRTTVQKGHDMSTEVLLSAGTGATDDHPAERRRRREGRALARFTALLGFVRAWVAKDERIAKMYITSEDGIVHLRAVAKSVPYDFELRRALSEFILKLTDGGFDVLGSLIPDGTPDELAAFFDPDQALVLSRQ